MKLKLFLITIVLFFLSACKKAETTPVLPEKLLNIYYSDLRSFIKRTNDIDPNKSIFADQYYTVVDEKWFMDNVYKKFNSFLEKNEIFVAKRAKNDCDDFARAFSFFSRTKSMKTGFLKYNLAVADLYFSDLDKGHAINIAVVLDSNNELKMLYIDPQGPTITSLSEDYKKYFVDYVGM